MYKMISLPYSFDCLEPYIDTHTLGLHYHKHYYNYLKKLNELLDRNGYQYQYPIELLSYHIDEFPVQQREDILFQLGGVLNHELYFRSMSHHRELPSKNLEGLIEQQFGSFDQLLSLFKKEALDSQGAGYIYLVIKRDRSLEIVWMSNQDSPYFHQLIPLVCVDLWEHAYYINYENKKDLYMDNFFEILDFSLANQIYKQFIS